MHYFVFFLPMGIHPLSDIGNKICNISFIINNKEFLRIHSLIALTLKFRTQRKLWIKVPQNASGKYQRNWRAMVHHTAIGNQHFLQN